MYTLLCVKQFVMSLPLGYWFSGTRKGGTEGGGLVYIQPKGENSMAVGLPVKIPQ